MKENIIAIDGPAGSGKSSVAKEIAKSTKFYYMDSGAYYRAITLYFWRRYQKENSPESFPEWLKIQPEMNNLSTIHLDAFLDKSLGNSIFLNSEDVSQEIRSPEVTEQIKYLAVLADIRNYVNQNLYKLSEKYSLIMDGRDIGTEVFPDARLKFFLTADSKIRAQRRWEEYKASGINIDLESLHNDIIRRDESDRNRKIAPLRMADDAILIDTSNLSKNIVINMILSRL